jgi:single-strand DNA-binding protein
MTDINTVFVIGRMTRNAEISATAGGTTVLKGSVAVSRSLPPKNDGEEWKQETSFFDFTLFGKTAESAAKWATKGKQVAIRGELRQDRWEDKNTMETRSKVYIVADKIQPLADPREKTAQPQQPSAAEYMKLAPQDAQQDADEFSDDIPF